MSNQPKDQIRSEHSAEPDAQPTRERLQGHRAHSGPLEGAIRVDEHVPVPGVIEPESKRWLGVDLVVLMIAGLLLVFIAFIAWQISLMPGPGKP